MNTELERIDSLAYGEALEEAPIEVRTQWSLVWMRFRRNRSALIGSAIVLLLIFVAVFAPILAPHDPAHIFDTGLTLDGTPVGPSAAFPLGADALGHDQLSRIIYGARISMTIAVVANGLAMLIGVVVGGLGGYYAGWAGMLVMRVTDIMMAFPILLLAIALVAVFSPSVWIVIGVIAFVYWTPIARIIHGEVLGLKHRDFVLAAKSMGLNNSRIMLRHLLPHVLPVIIVYGTLGIATNVLFEAALSYLGVGVQPPTPSWGGMISDGQTYYRSAPWLVIFPGLAIMITVLGFNLLGDGLRDALDPTRQDTR